MKSIQYLKYLILIVAPFSAIAHPGHQGFMDDAVFGGLMSIIFLALLGLAVFLHVSRRRKD